MNVLTNGLSALMRVIGQSFAVRSGLSIPKYTGKQYNRNYWDKPNRANRDRMPLSKDQRELLNMTAGRHKKDLVKQLKRRYGVM